ncbi:sigma-54 interaction domain-containing protein [Niveibacterium umoris]|uniref:DNA-binding NtrC family response regulator n=1 Tax=Niveibacterium umoris TaxID=1193620 RepID=A0A840BI94_9RHOO|nr:sigma-54 dependent transcriptional regulator [Niveibacterium umoris]MBB4013271.1 DNA-binding NtrC family response regulator [Niveibacterium umoris]
MSALQNLIGQSQIFLRAVALIERMARFDAPVLVTGETGTGKEVAARAIHYLSARRDAPFVPINCGALPDALIESELFGAEKGAYTDARQSRGGLVEAADGGTLFLDELESLPPRAQVSLLRFLQDQTYRPLGGTREKAANVRVVAAASPRLAGLIETGVFRPDLAWRLNVLAVELPPLRDRPGDATLLAEHFLSRYARRYHVAPCTLDPASLPWLESRPWPGNVRELDNLIHRSLLLCDGGVMRLGVLPASRRAPEAHAPVNFNDARAAAIEQFERQYLENLMRQTGGNVSLAARIAGKERRCLGKLLKKYGLDRRPADIATAPGSAQTHPGPVQPAFRDRRSPTRRHWPVTLERRSFNA